MDWRRRICSAISWRVESQAQKMAIVAGQRARNRCGHLLRWMNAYRSLPALTDRAVILCFHSIVDHRPIPGLEASMLEFRHFRQLVRVLKRSFNVIPLAELVAAFQANTAPPPRSVVITFDDGYDSDHRLAAPELAALKLPWSTFLPAGLIEHRRRQWVDDLRLVLFKGSRRQLRVRWDGEVLELPLGTIEQGKQALERLQHSGRCMSEQQRVPCVQELFAPYSPTELEELRLQYRSFEPMTWPQARELKAAGVDVGSHSMNHIALGPQSLDTIRHEVFDSRTLIAERLGDAGPHFSYPYGSPASISQNAIDLLAAAGCRCAVTLEQDAVRWGQHQLLRLPRIIVSPQIGRTLLTLWQKFAG